MRVLYLIFPAAMRTCWFEESAIALQHKRVSRGLVVDLTSNLCDFLSLNRWIASTRLFLILICLLVVTPGTQYSYTFTKKLILEPNLHTSSAKPSTQHQQ
jgi:hypothetical protein